jgi:outer membrane protein assembly factor BamB
MSLSAFFRNQPARGNACQPKLLLVGLLGGILHAVDPDSGESIWEFDSGSPMVSAHSPDTLIGSAPTFFPGADGALYHYNKEARHLEVSTSRLRF